MVEKQLDSYVEMVDHALDAYFTECCPQKELLDAMRYSLLAGGKRIRPVLVMQFCEACGGAREDALPAACGIEMLHTYSLIHDDLPCMDNDDLRRGHPTCHKAFTETYAVLAGDALQAAAFQSVLSAPVSAECRAAMAAALAEAAGAMGMCGGQYMDIRYEAESSAVTEEILYRIHALKTGALLRAACVMGTICGGGSEQQIKAAASYAEALGVAFQVRDDMLDVIATEEELGKNIGSDREEGKVTFVDILGLDACESLILEKTRQAKAAIKNIFPDTAFLEWLADWLALRTK